MTSPLALRIVGLGARCARPLLPLAWRKRLVSALAARGAPGQVTFGIELLRDMAEQDPVAFHQYLWANHVVYASTYDLRRYEPGALEKDRRRLFELLAEELRKQGLDPARDLHSLLDVGCSSGFLLRHVEVSLFPSAERLVGVDIDAHAVALGQEHLSDIGSKAELLVASMEDLDRVLPGERFDVVISGGALMYLDEERAARTVASLLRHADRAVGLIEPAHPDQDNRTLPRSAIRGVDETWIHNVDDMVAAAGGRVTARDYQPETASSSGVYVVVATPAQLEQPSGEPGRDEAAGT